MEDYLKKIRNCNRIIQEELNKPRTDWNKVAGVTREQDMYCVMALDALEKEAL